MIAAKSCAAKKQAQQPRTRISQARMHVTIFRMKKVMKKSSEYEPTIADVLGAVQLGFSKVDDRFDKVDDRFSKVDIRFDKIEGSLDDLGYRVTALEKRTGSLENAVEDMKETLDGVARAVDKDTLVVLDHGRRIRRLEKAH